MTQTKRIGSAIVVTDTDRAKLLKLTEALRFIGPHFQDAATELKGELTRATVVPRQNISPDVVTMNSTFLIKDIRTRQSEEFTLVYPNDSDILKGRMSVLAPLGLAMLGQRVGDVVRIHVPAGVRDFRLERLTYQPEAAGDEHL